MVATLLRLRRQAPALFLEGSYRPLEVEGEDASHVVAMARVHGERAILCMVPRLVLERLDQGLPPAWRARLPLPPELRREWVDILTGADRAGEMLDVGRCLGDFPVAVLGCRADLSLW